MITSLVRWSGGRPELSPVRRPRSDSANSIVQISVRSGKTDGEPMLRGGAGIAAPRATRPARAASAAPQFTGPQEG
jgi:hypothetical protein